MTIEVSLALLAGSVVLSAAILKIKTNGGKVDVREFHNFVDEIRSELRAIKSELETLRLLIHKTFKG